MTGLFSIINQELFPQETASLLINDLSIQRGYGIFDFLKLVNGKPVFIDDHITRFFNSAKEMRLEISHTPEELKGLVTTLIQKNNLPYSGVRMTLTGGYSDNGFSISKPNLVITQQALSFDEEAAEKGIRLVTYPHQRQFPHVKTIDYLMAVWLGKYIAENNADDVLYHQNRIVTECPRANFFMIDARGKIITPASHILKGVIRKHVLALSKSGHVIEKTNVNIGEIYAAKEAFITSTTKNIMPVVAVDGHLIGNGKIGEITRSLQKDLNQVTCQFQQNRHIRKMG